MKKKLYLILGLMLVLVVNGAIYAYTWPNTTTATIEVAAAENIATCNASATPPDWASLEPVNGDSGTVELRPAGPGAETNIQFQYPESDEHWETVADGTPDDWESYVFTPSGSYKRDLYELQDLGEDGILISGITVYFRFCGDEGKTAYARPAIKTDGMIYAGDEESQTGATFVTKSYQWTTNPSTGSAWTWSEIDELQVGVELKKAPPDGAAYCTQVYVAVNYEVPPITEGDVPDDGDLFVITPNPAYNGDLLVMVYLTNTGALRKAYQYLNMKLYVEGSLEADEVPDYQLLSIENGVVFFNIEWSPTESYTVEVAGGGYSLVSGDTSEWGDGWDITPEFYCEVSQR